jgi:bifunctional enzyme CysN/CysC
MKGEIKNFTGIDSPYEPPENPEIHLRTVGSTPEDMALALENWLNERDLAYENNDAGSGI